MGKSRPKKVQKEMKKYKEENPFCAYCLSTDNLTVHHLFDYSLGGSTDEDNLITLCRSCHDKVEKGEITITRFL